MRRSRSQAAQPAGLETRRMLAAIEGKLFDAGEPVRISRFEIGRRLGAGAMGTVYAAHDPELDRELAIKVIDVGVDDDEYGQRLAREAEAMAAVSHPNVLIVYEAGVFEGQPYIAMELVDGGTLGDWQSQRRSAAEILAMYVQAAHGLQAAHDHGLVHRDFKPANVLVGRDGRPRVADFGLVRLAGGDDPSASLPGARHGRTLSGSATTTGSIVGTPAYMSPEQYEGETATAASDQFSFCVALFEALHGHRPFAGRTIAELAAAVRSGTLHAPSSRHVPRRVRKALLRGLHLDPRHRHPSMRALAAALQRDRSPRRRAAGWLGVAAGMAALWGATRGDERSCDPQARVDAIWNAERRQAIRDRLENDAQRERWQRIDAEVDGYVADWSAAHRHACTDLAGTELDLAMRCLGRRLDQVATVVDVLSDPDTASAEALARLEPRDLFDAVDDCRDLERLAAGGGTAGHGSDDPASAAAEAELVRVRTVYRLGDFSAAVAAGVRLRPRVEAIGDERLLAHTELLLGLAYERSGDNEQAKSALVGAFTRARTVGEDVVALSAASRLVYLLATNTHELEEAERWVQHATALGVDDPEALYDLANSRAALARVQDRPEEALEIYAANLRAHDDIFGDDAARLGTLHSNIGVMYMDLRRHEEAMDHLRRAMALHEQHLGPEHPEIAVALMNIALTQRRLEQFDEAEATLRRALEIRRKSFGEQHPRVADVLAALAGTFEYRRDYDRAVEFSQRALEMTEATLGTTHLRTARALVDLAEVYRKRGDASAARPLFERAIVIETEALGPRALERAHTMDALARVLLDLGEIDLAYARETEALAIMREVAGPRAGQVALGLSAMAKIHAARGETELSLSARRQAIEIYAGLDHAPSLGSERNGLGDALRELGRFEEALEQHRLAVEHNERTRSPTHPYVPYSLFRVGLALEGLGRLEEASAAFERTMQIRAREDGRRFLAELPEARLALARVQLALGNRDRARALALAALDDYGDDPSHASGRGEARKLVARTRR